MAIDCKHWQDCGVKNGGCCGLGKYGGKPSLGVCQRVCEHGPKLKTPAPNPAGEANPKAEPKPPPTPMQVADAQRNAAICAICDRVKKDEHDAPKISLEVKGFPLYKVGCHDCGCAKLSLIDGDCPKGKWPVKQAQIFEEAMKRRKEREAKRAKQGATAPTSHQKDRQPTRPQKAVKRKTGKHKAAKDPAPSLVLRDAANRPIHLANVYQGASAFLLCGGPSLATMDLEPLKQPGFLTMAVNNAAKVFRPNLWTCVDPTWKFLRSIWFDPTITKFVPDKSRDGDVFDSTDWAFTGKKVHECPNVIYYPRHKGFKAGRFLDEPTICWGDDGKKGGGRSVMLAALRLLHHLGVQTVYLVGADFHMTESAAYAFEQDKDASAAAANNATYRKLDARFKAMASLFERKGFRVFNCTPDSALTAFPPLTLTEAVRRTHEALGEVDTEPTAGLYTTKKNQLPYAITRAQPNERTYLYVGESKSSIVRACRMTKLAPVTPQPVTKTSLFERFTRSHVTPELVIAWGFLPFMDDVRRWATERRVPLVHVEAGWFPHYTTWHADPQGFCWESSLAGQPWTDDPEAVFPAATAYRDLVLGRIVDNLPPSIREPFVLWPAQLITDRVNKYGLNVTDWSDHLRHFRDLLPRDTQLVVRPHPRAKKIADRRAMTQLQTVAESLPNTVFTTKGAMTGLLHRCVGVAGINSTVLFEASLIHRKQAWAYGRSWYDAHSIVTPMTLDTPTLIERDTEAHAHRRYTDWLLTTMLDRQLFRREGKHDQDALWRWLMRWAKVPT